MVGETLLAVFLKAIKKDTDRNEITVVKAPDAKALADIKGDTANLTADPSTGTKQDDILARTGTGVTASDNLRVQSTAERTNATTVYIKTHEIEILISGVYRFKFEIKQSSSGGAVARGWVYNNGAPLGAAYIQGNNGTSGYVWRTEPDDFFLDAGDLVQLYIAVSAATVTATARNFGVYADFGLSYGGVKY